MSIEKIEEAIIKYLFLYDLEFCGDEPALELYNQINWIRSKIPFNEFNDVFNILLKNKYIDIRKFDETEENELLVLSKLFGLPYAINKGYVTTLELVNYFDIKYQKICEGFVDINKTTIEQIKWIGETRKELTDSLNNQKIQIKNFYNNIINILGILIGAFAIIGFNIGGIKFIIGSEEAIKPFVYAGSIAVINLSIVLSLYILFHLINKIVNPQDSKHSKKISRTIKSLIIPSILFIVLIILSFILALNK